MNRIKITEFPIKNTITNNEYLVAVDGNRNYLVGLSACLNIGVQPIQGDISVIQADIAFIEADISNLQESISSTIVDITTIRELMVNGFSLSATTTLMLSTHNNGYLSFTASPAVKTYTVVVNDGFPQWGVVTLRNSANTGNLIVGEEYGVTLDGDQGRLSISPKGSLQLIKADTLNWHIL